MKNIFCFVFLLSINNLLFSKTYHISNQNSPEYLSFNKAFNDAYPFDTIILENSEDTYPDIKISKPLIIFGKCNYSILTNQDSIKTKIGSLYLLPGSKGSIINGLKINYETMIEDDSIIISNCRLNQIYINNTKSSLNEIQISNNIIESKSINQDCIYEIISSENHPVWNLLITNNYIRSNNGYSIRLSKVISGEIKYNIIENNINTFNFSIYNNVFLNGEIIINNNILLNNISNSTKLPHGNYLLKNISEILVGYKINLDTNKEIILTLNKIPNIDVLKCGLIVE
jgi:hypothetical protein